MSLYLGNDLIGNIYIGTAAGGIANITLNNPTITVSNTGLITAQVTQSTGGVIPANSTASSTQQLSTVSSATITPTSSSQTAVAANKYTLGAITVAAVPTETKSITSNGTYTPTTGKWFSSVTVNVPTGSTINNQNKTVTPSTSLQTIIADSGYTGLGTVTVNAIPSNYIIPTGNKAITSNGTNIDVTSYATVSVNVPTGGTINNQSKTVDPDDVDVVVTPDSGYTGLSQVTITAIPDDYIGSSIPINDVNDLTVNGATVTAAEGYYDNDVSKTVASGTAGTPTATKNAVTNHSISVTPSVTNTTGYITGGTKTGTAVTVMASELVSGNKAITANGNNIDVTNYATVSVNVSSQALNLQAKTNITPTTSSQTISPDSGYDGLSSVQINAIPSQYKNTSDANAVAANILADKTAYNSTGKITGTMPNNGATGGTITTQGGTYTIPAGYTSGGTVTATLAAGSTTVTNISGAAFEETTGDYGFRASIQIQPGYYASATTVTKDFSSILPAPTTEGTSPQLLTGYDLYNHDGELISGSMTNNSIGTITLDQTTTSYTIPAGYHDGTGKVQHTTVNIPDPTISVNSSGVITASGSWTRGFTTDNSYSNTYNLTTLAATTYNVSASNQTISSGKYITGTQTIRAVTTSNITAANVKAGVTVQVGDSADSDRILGITGTFTADADAIAADLNSGKTAYVNGVKITGTQVINKFYTGSSAPSSSLGNNGDIYLQE